MYDFIMRSLGFITGVAIAWATVWFAFWVFYKVFRWFIKELDKQIPPPHESIIMLNAFIKAGLRPDQAKIIYRMVKQLRLNTRRR